jgi:hypothetical protein
LPDHRNPVLQLREAKFATQQAALKFAVNLPKIPMMKITVENCLDKIIELLKEKLATTPDTWVRHRLCTAIEALEDLVSD